MELSLFNQYTGHIDFLENLLNYLAIFVKINASVGGAYVGLGPLRTKLDRLKGVVQALKSRSLKNDKLCVFIGRVSSGKSALINAVLDESLLPVGCGVTSRNSVVVRQGPEENVFIYHVDKSLQLVRDEEASLAGLIKDAPLSSVINVFVPPSISLLTGLTICDTPGLGRPQKDGSTLAETSATADLCGTADLIILVVSAIMELGHEDVATIVNPGANLAKTDVVVVYNFWDWPSSDIERVELKEKYIEEAKMYFKDQLPSEGLGIYFISATGERQSTNESICSYELEELRAFLKKESRELPYFRKIRFFRKSMAVVSEIILSFDETVNNFINELKILLTSLKDELKTAEAELKPLTSKYLDTVNKTSDQICEKVIKYANDNKDLSGLLDHKQVYLRELEEMSVTITDLVASYPLSSPLKLVLTEKLLRIPALLFGITDESDSIGDDLSNIQFKARLKSNLGKGVDLALEAASRTTGGVSSNAICVLSVMGDITRKVTGKDVSGASLLRLVKRPFGSIVDKEETHIKKQFKEIKQSVKESIDNLSSQIETDFKKMFEEVLNHLDFVKSNYNVVKEADERFINNSVFYL